MINDPLMGTLMDKAFANHSGARDKFRPWILWSIPLIVVGLISFFAAPTYFSGAVQVVAIFLFKVIYELGYTMMNIGMGSLLGVMALNDEERTTLASARGLGSIIGIFITQAMVPAVLARLGENTTGYAVCAVIAAILGGFIIFIHYAWTEERNVSVQEMVSGEEEEGAKFTDIFVTIKENRAFLALALHSIIIVFGQQLFGQTSMYMFADVFGNLGIMSYMSIVTTAISLVALLASPALVRVVGSTVHLIRIFLIISVIMFLSLFGLMQVTSLSPLVYLIWHGLAAGFMNMSISLQWGLVSESIDYNEYLTGKRSEGTIYGNFSLTRRLGQMLSQSLVILMIGWIGYDTAAAEAGLAQSDGTIFGLTVMNVLVPAFAALGSYLCFRFIWNIDDELRAKMAAHNIERAEQNPFVDLDEDDY
ncbi:hypothetical protein AWM75_01840 [Aerococcus urinaehominis]|uniref:Uncharacterized protein n=1 Tax=Aerococcus urinaehominis TaxID=128944 RepID=A0A0X8FK62_9LACT|nr:MFS transporter [Aerococcus urinaehominis]AMB98810.1 hypothetical protein AWM75_01840 [Aerococcus urinaehominis]SDM49458.1 Na+/melibiose symporter [Aerococcus urinaehominis]